MPISSTTAFQNEKTGSHENGNDNDLIGKNEHPFEVQTNIVDSISTQFPTSSYDFGFLYVASTPYGANIYIDGYFVGNTIEGHYQPLNVGVGNHTIQLTMSEYIDYCTTEYISLNQITYLYPSLTEVAPTFTSETGYIYFWSNSSSIRSSRCSYLYR